MTSVLLSIRPRHIENICTVVGEKDGKPIYKKRVEVRKTAPKSGTPFKCNIYCTQGKLLYEDFPNGTESREIKLATYPYVGQSHALNGKVIGEFVCDRIDKQIVFHKGITRIMVQGYKEKLLALCKASALSLDELHGYIDKDGKDFEIVYGWHISDLKIYDEPKELSEFYKVGFNEACKDINKDCGWSLIATMGKFSLKCPPQSWRRVEEL